MKKIIAGLLIAVTSLTSFAQSFQFIESTTGNPAQDSYARQAADTIGDEFILHCINHSATSKSAKVRMTVLSTPSGCTNGIFFCDPIACYPASVHLSVAAFTIGAGDTVTGALVPHIDQGFCCGDYAVSYCLFDVNNENDSMNVIVYYNVNGNHCTNGIGELASEYFLGNAFPNPTFDKCTIAYSMPEQPTTSALVLYTITGKKITEYRLENNQGELVIDPVSLTQGIYFYSLLINGKLTFSKKLVIIKK